MAVNDITIINGVTKRETATGFVYLFNLAYIETNTASTVITIRTSVDVRFGGKEVRNI